MPRSYYNVIFQNSKCDMFKYNSKILQYQNTSLGSCYCFCYKAFVRLISIFKPFWLSYPNSLSITYMICITVILVLCFFVKIGLWKSILFVLFVKCFKRKLEFFVSLVYTVEKKKRNMLESKSWS